jgi:hypothetical protein
MAPQKYRKKPVVIEAMQWVGPASADVHDWMRVNGHPTGYDTTLNELRIYTLEDGMSGAAKHVASPGDWIIRGVQGEMYACKPDIFAATYEAV